MRGGFFSCFEVVIEKIGPNLSDLVVKLASFGKNGRSIVSIFLE